MANELVPVSPDRPPSPASAIGPAELLAHWLAGRSPRTVRAYTSDLRNFAHAIIAVDVPAAIGELLALSPGDANALVLAYRNRLLGEGLATATIARRLAALRSVVDLARTLGLVPWSLGISSPRVEPRRDVRGPDRADRAKLWRVLRSLPDTPANRRDRAIVALLFDLGLRRGEVVALEVADFDRAAGELAVLGKGKREKVRLTLPPATRAALEAHLEARGIDPGPLIPISGEGIRQVIASLGRLARLPRPLRPHGLRHAAITAALDSGSDVRSVRKFSRHAKIDTVLKYDDAREDAAGDVAKNVSKERK